MDNHKIGSARYEEIIDLLKKNAQSEYEIKNSLAYRLGKAVITQYKKSFWGFLTIPFILARESLKFKKEKKERKRQRFSGEICKIHNGLWGGFSEYYVKELENLIHDKKNKKADRLAATIILSQWFNIKNEFLTAYQYVKIYNNLKKFRKCRQAIEAEIRCHLGLKYYPDAMKKLCVLLRRNTINRYGLLLLRMMCLGHLKRCSNVVQKIDSLLRKNMAYRYGLFLLRARILRQEMIHSGRNSVEANKICLDALNELFSDSGLETLALRNPEAGAHFNNIHAPTAKPHRECTSRVSVLMPAYNAAETIETALRSLLEQAWTDLEIIVVDDASTDETCVIVERLCREDSRIRLVRQEKNQGTYCARNKGLEYVTGDFITVHDSDDWSHPQKIAVMVEALFAAPGVMAAISMWLRVMPDLEAVGGWQNMIPSFTVDMSSLLFRKSMIEAIGPWDEVRTGADNEFIERIKAQFGETAILEIKKYPLLALALIRDNSLTRTKATHVASIHNIFGVRYNYRKSSSYWHEKDLQRSGRLHIKNKELYVPLCIRKEKIINFKCDIIIACDFSMRGGAYVSCVNYAFAAHSLGKNVAFLHWPYAELRPIKSRIYEICCQSGMNVLTSADNVTADFLLIGYPPIATRIPSSLPNIQAGHVVVLVNQFAERLREGIDVRYDPTLVHENLQKTFESGGTWIPISNLIRHLMEADARYPKPWPKPWHPLIDTKPWLAEPIHWRGMERAAPVIGRHGRDHYVKWPANVETLKRAYGVNAPVNVHFMGGARRVIEILGYRPANWTIYEFDALPLWLFLKDIDFLIHFPHEEWIEAFGRVAMEGMLAGKVVILPPHFHETFGEAAVYCEAREVIPTVMRYWGNEQLYLEQAELGRAFVVRNCDWSCLAERLADLGMM